MEFTDAEIREELARLGYRDVPDDKLQDFKKDLLKLIQSERSKTNSLNSSMEERHEKSATSAEEDFIRDANHWREPRYKEDWEYGGIMDEVKSRPATSHASIGRRDYADRSFGLFEQPMNLGLESQSDQNLLGANNSRSCGCIKDGRCSYCYSCPSDKSKKQMKRKTARPSSRSQPCTDDSASECDAGIYELYERVRNMAMRDCECYRGGATSADKEALRICCPSTPPYRIQGENKNPSVIKSSEPPHTRNLVRTIPWKRHQMYVRMWKAQPLVMQDKRTALRKETQARMLQKQDFKAGQRKVFRPNKYVPPTDNPRYQLRWDVRRANSAYEMPSVVCGNYQYQRAESYC